MKTKTRIIFNIIISALVIGLLTTIVMAVSDLSKLKGTKNSKIGNVFTISYFQMQSSKNIYCIQKDKTFKGEVRFILKNYVEIDGKEAKVYSSSSNKEPNIVKSKLNAQVAYILNRQQGYGSYGNPTDAQEAMWYITNKWTTKIFNNSTYSWIYNTRAKKNRLYSDSEKYADSIDDVQETIEDSKKTLEISDKTNKDNVSRTNIDGYFRIGPFRWEFDGTLQNITVTGDKGVIDSSNIRFVKYTGKEDNIVDVSKILTGEDFYIDINQKAGVAKINSLKLKTKSSVKADDKIYTAKIWFFHAASFQNIIYVDVGDKTTKPIEAELSSEYDIGLNTNIGLVKVDDRDTNIPLQNVGFKFKATVYRYIIVGNHIEMKDYDGDKIAETPVSVDDWDWRWVERYLGSDLTWSVDDIEKAEIFYTNENGLIDIDNIFGETVENDKVDAIEVSNPYYGYEIGQEYTISIGNKNRIQLENHQCKVKLSGYVWIDKNDGKASIRNNVYDADIESGFNGIRVYLKDIEGNTILQTTTTSELGLYSEINGGEYQFTNVDLDRLQNGYYYIEFEYCGITYQSVAKSLNTIAGSKAIDDSTRNVLDNKFASVNGTGTQSLRMNDVTVNYNGISNYYSTINNHTGCNVYARTNEAGYDLYSGFKPTSEEIRYINLGLFEKTQSDFALAQDLYNVKVSVNGFSHVYKYGEVRYSNNGENINEDSSWNMGVKFQKNNGKYSRAIYESDSSYETKDKSREIQVYVTYKIALKNESSYLGRINKIVDYCDNRYEIVNAGNSIKDETAEVTDILGKSSKNTYNDKYSRYEIDVNSTLSAGETKYLYVQFRMDRNAVLMALGNEELLNNVAEITSYTTFKNNNVNTPVAVIDEDSVPGNAIPGNIDTYEDDTDAARSLKLELRNERAIVGTVFLDEAEKSKEPERLGNGEFDKGEKTLEGIKVELREILDDNTTKLAQIYDSTNSEGVKWKDATTFTNKDGNFEIRGYIPGKYVVTYTWGDKTYMVQYYKGTIYDETRKQDNPYWYKGIEYKDDTISVDKRKTDALDSREIRRKIDEEMENLKYNTLENEIKKAYGGGSEYIKQTTMKSTTPKMEFSVEYETTVTDGTKDEVLFTVKNVDFGIIERAKQKLEFSKRVSAFKITLANGQVLVDAEVTEDGKVKGLHDYTTYLGPTNVTDGLIRIEMDNELIEGATLETIYTMKVKNVGETDYISDRYYYYGNSAGAEKVKVSVTELIDYVDGRLSVLGDIWTESNKDYLEKVNASQKGSEEYLNSTRIYLTKELAKELAPGEEKTVDLSTSKLLTSTDDNTFNNQSEITEVSKNSNPNRFSTGTPVQVVWGESGIFYFNEDNAEKVIIIPSTGENRGYSLPTIIGITSLFVFGLGAFGIKKFVIDR